MQSGGALAKKSLFDLFEKTKMKHELFLYTFFLLAIVFKETIPPVIYQQADSLLGRLFIVILLFLLLQYYDWTLSLLATVAFVLLLGLPVPRSRPSIDGFQDADTHLSVIPPTKKRWFVERLFKEHPIVIEEEKVVTTAVQDNSRSGANGNVQNSSLQ